MGAVVTMIGLTVDNRPVRPPRPHLPSAAELAAHAAFLLQLSDPLWLKA
jgi:DNA polymerase-3 subunit epsilon